MERIQILFKELEDKIDNNHDELLDWSKNYFNETNKKRYINDLAIINEYYTDGEILEIGSAPYHLTFLLKSSGYRVTGIDIDPQRQSSFIKDAELNIVKCDIENEPLPFEENSFKYIIFNEIFEHLRINPIQTLREINRVLHPDGVFVISTPNLYGLRNVVNLLLGKGFDNPYEEFLKIETIQHMGHVRVYSVKQMKVFLLNTGFTPLKTQIKTFERYRGLWRLLIIFPLFFKHFNTIQIHICRKTSSKIK